MLKRGSKWKALYGTHRVVTSVVLIVVVLIVFVFVETNKPSTRLELPKQNSRKFKPLVQFHPTTEFQNGTDVIWQIPMSPKAVLFLAHGCGQRAENFWDKSPGCPKCVGMPEDRILALHALARSFALITISSAAKCWNLGEERLVVKNIITRWVHSHKLEKLPLVALGASSGGYFVSALATDLKFSSIVLMIAEGVFDLIDITVHYPPTLFLHMPKDLHRQQKIREYVQLLSDKGIDVAEVECMDFPLSPNLLADRIPSLDQTVSAKLFVLFQRKGFIDEKGYMKRDGRATRWKEALREDKTIALDKSLIPLVQEELNLAFAYHEMTSLQSDKIFQWFESHMSIL